MFERSLASAKFGHLIFSVRCFRAAYVNNYSVLSMGEMCMSMWFNNGSGRN